MPVAPLLWGKGSPHMSEAKSKTAAPAPTPQTLRMGSHLAKSDGVTPATSMRATLSAGAKRASLQADVHLSIDVFCPPAGWAG